ncbi:2-dehydro-3-deoxygalactonokinase [Niveispirillum fermenti]|uniref:2-dehydro-3-deoxygalactonokinase n=1 Tax=Niveispirillum fermenti TaxID=1233113 RepID=UPI003A8C56EB
MSKPAFLGIDWGTTNRRVHVLGADGFLLTTQADDKGVLSLTRDQFPAEIAALRARFGDLTVIAAGMVGSARGWVEVPYLPCPVTLGELAGRLCWVEPGRTAIVPGVAIADPLRPEVMRGEEVQILGAVQAGLVPPDALLCQPGTHSKWATLSGGTLTGFRTAMTGELFALLRRHSLLSGLLDGPVEPGPDFDAGLALAMQGAPLGRLFGERAAALLGLRDPASVAARVSGLLIGGDVAEQGLAPGQPVHLLADGMLARLYATAIGAAGGTVHPVSSQAAFLAGIIRICLHQNLWS